MNMFKQQAEYVGNAVNTVSLVAVLSTTLLSIIRITLS